MSGERVIFELNTAHGAYTYQPTRTLYVEAINPQRKYVHHMKAYFEKMERQHGPIFIRGWYTDYRPDLEGYNQNKFCFRENGELFHSERGPINVSQFGKTKSRSTKKSTGRI